MTAGLIAATSSGKWPGRTALSFTTLIAASTAPHRGVAQHDDERSPRNCTPYSMDASRSGVTTLPATRTTKRSPGAWSNASSGATRESAHSGLRRSDIAPARARRGPTRSRARSACWPRTRVAFHQPLQRIGGRIAFCPVVPRPGGWIGGDGTAAYHGTSAARALPFSKFRRDTSSRLAITHRSSARGWPPSSWRGMGPSMAFSHRRLCVRAVQLGAYGVEIAARYAWSSIAAAVATIVLKGARVEAHRFRRPSVRRDRVVRQSGGRARWRWRMLDVAARPADDAHAHGHTKAEYFSSAFEGFLIFGAAAWIAFEAIERLRNPRPVQLASVGLLRAVVATIVNFATARILMTVGRASRSITWKPTRIICSPTSGLRSGHHRRRARLADGVVMARSDDRDPRRRQYPRTGWHLCAARRGTDGCVAAEGRARSGRVGARLYFPGDWTSTRCTMRQAGTRAFITLHSWFPARTVQQTIGRSESRPTCASGAGART